MAANSLYEGPREGVRRQVFVPNWGKQQRDVLRADHAASTSAFTLIRNEVKQLDAGDAGLRDEDAAKDSSTRRC